MKVNTTDVKLGAAQGSDSAVPVGPEPQHCGAGSAGCTCITTYCIILAVLVSFFSFVIPGAHVNVSPVVTYIAVFLAIMLFTTLVRTSFGDPGRIAKGQPGQAQPPTPGPQYRWCWYCHCWRPPDAAHCVDCGYCCEGYDHHCPFVGNCIGKKNMPYFQGMLGSLALNMVFMAMSSIMFMAHQRTAPKGADGDEDTSSSDRNANEDTSSDRNGHTMGWGRYIVAAVLFAFLAACLRLCRQAFVKGALVGVDVGLFVLAALVSAWLVFDEISVAMGLGRGEGDVVLRILLAVCFVFGPTLLCMFGHWLRLRSKGQTQKQFMDAWRAKEREKALAAKQAIPMSVAGNSGLVALDAAVTSASTEA